jgi:hypothetical protein
MATENTTINATAALEHLEQIQETIEQIQAIAITALAADPQRDLPTTRLFDVINCISEDAADYHALRRMLQ